jgi:[ribosomal protein S5]-alanine N-acetyltransferase
MTELSTARLLLSPLRDSDIAALHAIQSDRDAMRFTHVATSLDASARRLWAYERARAHQGFAPWVVSSRSDGTLIGWGGLGIDPFDPGWGVEVSYFLARACWGRGLATELVSACLDHAFGALSLPSVAAFAMPENVASIRVLDKCGFAFLRHEPDLERNHYQARRPSGP